MFLIRHGPTPESGGLLSAPLEPESSTTELRGLVYIYDWPDDVVRSWPANYTHFRLSIEKRFSELGGAGPLLNATKGLHRTHQYALFAIFHQRLLRSGLVTRDPSQASLFFIPYDLGMDATTRSSDGALVATSCPRQSRVLTALTGSTHFARHGGKDHFLVYSINQMMVHFTNRPCRRLLTLCVRCTKLSIDAYSAETYRDLALMPELVLHWHSVPFPSDLHRSSVATALPWESLREGVEAFAARRTVLVAFVGSSKVTAARQRVLRQALLRACQRSPIDCTAVALDSHSSQAVYPRDLYERARLCLCPGGDFPTRKAFVDALLSGCIPVIFQPVAALSQWAQHWGSPAQAAQCTVLLPMDEVLSDAGAAVRTLVGLARNLTFLRSKIECIARVAERFQYSLAEGPEEERARRRRHGPDAFDLALNVAYTATDEW